MARRIGPRLDQPSSSRPDVLAYNRAEDDLRRAFPVEFDQFLALRREELGLHPKRPESGGPDRRVVGIDDAVIRRAWRDGQSFESLAEQFGVHVNTVRARAHRMGLRRKKGWNLTAEGRGTSRGAESAS